MHGEVDSVHVEIIASNCFLDAWGIKRWCGMHDEVDSVHVERIGSSGDQLLKNSRLHIYNT